MKPHDKDNGSASKQAKPAPSNLEKPASAELQFGKTVCFLSLLFFAAEMAFVRSIIIFLMYL